MDNIYLSQSFMYTSEYMRVDQCSFMYALQYMRVDSLFAKDININ